MPSLYVGFVPTINAVVTPGYTPLTASAPSFVNVGLAAANIVNSSAARKGLVLTNTHQSLNVSFGINAAAILNGGITLTPNGVWVMDAFTFTTASVNAIAGGASVNVAVQELT